MFTVFTLPNCVQCKMTIRLMEQLQLSYKVIDLTKNPSIRKEFQQLGYRSAPVVKSDAGEWAGFQPNKIKEMGARFSKK
ncbi:glutaredoxin domain-containing protein [Limosilactobacillus ingluviei]|uniref:glutaredoxin domain-containing protein n=1 Tax=Limosilactobacillus ingluviei TaxID=148604 RepID=UPI0007051708|nr:glutaredoxin domain-containing protein [Limosilactobacillus ingluviei]